MWSSCYAATGMGGRRVILNEDKVVRAVATIGECLSETAWGRATWDDVCRCFAQAMPGSVPIIRNVDLTRRAVHTMFVEGIEPERVAAYRARFAAVDPWMTQVDAMQHGEIRATEHTHPSSSFRDSEFYTDWLAQQDNLKAATGIRIDIDARDAVIMCWHYPVEKAPLLDGPAAAMLDRLKPLLIDAVRSAAMLRQGLEQSPRLGSLIERIGGGAMLVDARRRIREMNAEAVMAGIAGEIYSDSGGILTLRDPVAQRWLEETIVRLIAGEGPPAVATFLADNKVLRLNVTRAPDRGGPEFSLLVHPRPHVLVVIRCLTGRSLQLDTEALRLAFGLSAAEAHLCEFLANGFSLVETASILGISEGTARQRTKAVFQKTGTHRQGELIALVSPFAHNC